MPELPEIEAIRQYLGKNLEGQVIKQVFTSLHTVIRTPGVEEFVNELPGTRFSEFQRTGKILHVITIQGSTGFEIFLDFGLTGRLSWRREKKNLPAKTVIRFVIEGGTELIYHDRRLHGSIWIFRFHLGQPRQLPPVLTRFGPDILSIDTNTFHRRAARYRGEIKSILTNQQFVAGIGNAYADEILFEAQIHPFTKRTQLSKEDLEKLFQTSRLVLTNATNHILTDLNSNHRLNNEKIWRKQLFQVHLRGGEPCPICKRPLREIKTKRLTNFCRTCQPTKNIAAFR
ncbi:MAG: Fpg/Nei family DNA glycosylase [Candidatus Thorarchaeota archaeon]